MIISLAGDPGSGKSTIAKKLAKKLGWPNFYIGKIRRLKAKKLGLTLAEYNRLGETDPQTDLEVDQYQKQLTKKYKNFVIEGRTSWYFLPQSIKIYLAVKQLVGAKRVFSQLRKKDTRNEDKNLLTVEDVLRSHRQRRLSDKKRYWQYYKIDVFDKKNYDYVIDTTTLNRQQVFNKVYQYVKNKLNLIDKKE